MSYFLFLFNPRTARETRNSIAFVELPSSRHQQERTLVAMHPYNQTSRRFLLAFRIFHFDLLRDPITKFLLHKLHNFSQSSRPVLRYCVSFYYTKLYRFLRNINIKKIVRSIKYAFDLVHNFCPCT